MVEKDKDRTPMSFYDLPEDSKEPVVVEKLGLKSTRPSDKIVVSARLDGGVVSEAREYCHAYHVTFSSMIEIGLRLALDAAESAERLRRAGGK